MVRSPKTPQLSGLVPAARTGLERWQRAMDVPLLFAAVVFLVAYATPILWLDLPSWARSLCRNAQIVVWVAFAADLAIRVILADDRRRYLLTHWLDILAVALPALRPVVMLRALLARSILSGRGLGLFRGQLAAVIAAAAGVVSGLAALSVLEAERGRPEANIVTVSDALWWAMTTVTTVGYGDRYPTTTTGRLIAAALMVTGIALLGVVTATLASWFVDRVSELRQTEEHTEVTLETLLEEVRVLREEVARLHRTTPSPRAR